VAGVVAVASGCCWAAAQRRGRDRSGRSRVLFPGRLAAASMRRDLLGPMHQPGRAPQALSRTLRDVVSGLADGCVICPAPRPRGRPSAIGAYRILFGIVFLMSILLYRNYFYRAATGTPPQPFHAGDHRHRAGYGLAAVVSPPVTRRFAKHTWITFLLACSGLVMGLGLTFSQVPFLVIGFVLGLTGQASRSRPPRSSRSRPVTPTAAGRSPVRHDVQRRLRRRAVFGALIIPVDGKSYPLIVVTAAGYVLAAVLYARCGRADTGNEPASGPGNPSPRPSGAAPESPAPGRSGPARCGAPAGTRTPGRPADRAVCPGSA